MAVALAIFYLCLVQVASTFYIPTYSETATVLYNVTGESNRFPDQTSVEEDDYTYFISGVNFKAISGKLLIGAADTLYMMNPNLTVETALDLSVSQSDVDTCTTSIRPDNSGFACHNHIRVFKKIPGQDTLLVCGTYAGVEPHCLGVEISDGMLLAPAGNGEVASDGIISYFPEFSQFGDFRNDGNSDDPVYLSAGFFDGDSGAGRHFSIAYKNISLTTPADSDTLQTTELFRTINANNNWLRFPVTFVGSEKLDYSSASSPTQREADYQFWFLLLRENLVTNDIIYSRLVRVCRNDPGSTMTSDGARYFTTFMKTRIYCERERPTSLDFTGSLNYIYDGITSFTFTDSSRYYSDGPYQKHFYGTFTGPLSGPVGSAICVYSAENTVETGGTGRSGSTFDIFREDLSTDSDGNNPVENDFTECAPEGRQGDDQQLLFIAEMSVNQLGDDPILILDDVIVNQMVQDSVCVVTRDDSSRCINQDVLFLGLSSGHVLKVVFATDVNGDIEPLIVEDIQFDDSNEIVKMTLQEESGLLYVSTWSKIYSLTRHRCSRFDTCSTCVGARDPYCVWSNEILQCVQSPLTASGSAYGTVNDTLYFQNIHTANSTGCNYPEINFVDASVLVSEGMTMLAISIRASAAGYVEFFLEEGTATVNTDYQGLPQVIEFTSESTLTVSVTLLGDSIVEGDEWFLGHLRGVINRGVIINKDTVNITIEDDDNVDFSFSDSSYSGSEGGSFIIVTVEKAGETNFLASVILQSSSGTAVAGVDYLVPDVVLTFDPMTTTQNVVIPLINDDVMESDEGFSLNLLPTNKTEGIIISMDTASIMISDDDVVSICLSPSSSVVFEDDGLISVQLVKSGQTQLPVTVILSTVDGTATAPNDYTAIDSDVITFLANQTSVTATVTIVNDVIAEDDEIFYLMLTTDIPRGVIADDRETIITITDTDSVILRLASTAYTWNEGDGEVSIVIEKIGTNEKNISTFLQIEPTTAEVELDYRLADMYNIQFSPSDSLIEVPLFIIDDNELEDMETLFIALNNGPSAAYDQNNFANATIIDNDIVTVQVDVESCALTITESAGSIEIEIARIGLSSIPVDVMVSIENGSATDSSDFSSSILDSVVTIPPSVSTITLLVPILDDEIVESEIECFNLIISANQSGVTTDNSTVYIMITDDDSVSISLSESSLLVSEEVGVVNITLTLSGSHSIPVSVSVYTIPASANAGEDFIPIADTVIFQPGVSYGSVLVTLVDDNIRELTETFQVSFDVDDVVILAGSITHTTVSIIDSDTVEIRLSNVSESVLEARGVVTMALQVLGQSSIDVRVNITTLDGTATAEEDYQPQITELIFAPYDTSYREMTIILIDDIIREETEHFIVEIVLDPLTSVGVILQQNSPIIEIQDDDIVTVSWSSTSYTVSEKDSVLELTLFITGSTSYGFTLFLSTLDGTAMAGLDYTPLSSHQVDIDPSDSSVTVTFNNIVLDDDLVETVEQFIVTVEIAVGEEGVILDEEKVFIFITSDEVVQIQFLNINSTVIEGVKTDLTIISSPIAPFDITISASVQTTSLEQQIPSDYLYLLQNPVTILAGSISITLPIFSVPNLVNRTEYTADIVLELVNGTQSVVELGTKTSHTVTIINVDISASSTGPTYKCPTIPTPTTTFTSAIVSTVFSCTTTTSSSMTPSPSPFSNPTVITGGVIAENSECFYSSEGVALAVTVLLAILVIILCCTNTLTFFILFCFRQRQLSSHPSTCDLKPISNDNNIYGGKENETVFTNMGAGSEGNMTTKLSDWKNDQNKDVREENGVKASKTSHETENTEL